MSDPFDIFQKEAEDTVMWQGSEPTLDRAKVRIRELATTAPGKYIILDRHTGSKFMVNSQTIDECPAADASLSREKGAT